MSGPTVETWRPALPEFYPTPKAAQFVSGDAFMALAVKAYLAACRRLVPPPGEPWAAEGATTWASAETFHEDLLFEVGERLRRAGIESGDLREEPAHPINLAPSGCRGGAPAVKGHGCPALAPAVGPAPALAQAADITVPADPLFCGQQVQELPGDLDPATVTQQREGAPC